MSRVGDGVPRGDARRAGSRARSSTSPASGAIRNNTDFSSTGITDPVATKDDPFLQPFADGIEAGAGLVMMASARYPKLDDDNPAMFSEKIVTGLLREQMGYDGVVITDDVDAEALDAVPAGDRAVRTSRPVATSSSRARPRTPTRCSRRSRPRSPTDDAFAAKVDASVERVLTLKERMGLLPCSTTTTTRALTDPSPTDRALLAKSGALRGLRAVQHLTRRSAPDFAKGPPGGGRVRPGPR